MTNGMELNGIELNGMEWNGMEWNGMEWNGMEWNETSPRCQELPNCHQQALGPFPNLNLTIKELSDCILISTDLELIEPTDKANIDFIIVAGVPFVAFFFELLTLFNKYLVSSNSSGIYINLMHQLS